eukprot:1145843-Pelagomonas_calceolata.AAC.14
MAAFTLQAHYSSCACFMIEATQSLAMLCGRSKEHHAKASLIFKSVSYGPCGSVCMVWWSTCCRSEQQQSIFHPPWLARWSSRSFTLTVAPSLCINHPQGGSVIFLFFGRGAWGYKGVRLQPETVAGRLVIYLACTMTQRTKDKLG